MIVFLLLGANDSEGVAVFDAEGAAAEAGLGRRKISVPKIAVNTKATPIVGAIDRDAEPSVDTVRGASVEAFS
jgi:hypothetical protein